MSSKRSLLGRLFGALWFLVDATFKLIVIGLVLLVVGGLWLATRGGGAGPRMEDKLALVIYPTGQLVDSTDEDPTQRFVEEFAGGSPAQTPLRHLTEALEAGAKDGRIALAVLKLDGMYGAGLAQMQELAAAVKAFRAAGKPVYAYGPYYDQDQYLAASEADHVTLDPMGLVFLEGLGSYQLYFREALDKLGVQVHVFRVGEYKSAVEPFERNDMSAEAREANKDWLGDLWRSYGREVGRARQLPETAVDQYVAGLPAGLSRVAGDGAAVAQQARLVDEVQNLQQFRAKVAETVGWDEDIGTFRQIHHREYLAVLEREKSAAATAHRKTIALVVVQGEIVDGDSEQGMAGADTVSDLLTDARLDESVAAVLLRVDSPGGSVFASEQIRREVQALQADGKPVVVSMGNVAASGGYWISMDADEILAHDTTITGSIGIFGLIPTFEKPLAKLGVHSDGLGTTALAGALRADRPMTPEAALLIQSQIERGYAIFTEGVSAARELPIEKVREIARGRVWSGADAVGLGLVDRIGGLNDAIASAVRLANLEPGSYELVELQPPRDFPLLKMLEFFGTSGQAQASAALRAVLPGALAGPVAHAADSLRWMRDARGVYAHCLCSDASRDSGSRGAGAGAGGGAGGKL